MKKFLIFVSVLAIAFTQLYANGSKEQKGSEVSSAETVLRVVDWSDSSAQFREVFNKKFEEAHPGVKVEYTCLTIDQFKNTIVTMLKSGDAPDLFPIPSNMTLPLTVQEEWYQPIDSYITEEFKATLNPIVFANGITTLDNHLYTIPEQMPNINSVFFYNKDLLKEAGVTKLPETYSEFIDACQKVTDKGDGQYYGLIEGGIQLNRLDTMARALTSLAGGKIAGSNREIILNGKSNLNSPEMKNALDFINELTVKGLIYPDTVSINAPTARELFSQGQAAFLMQGMWCIPIWAASYPDLNYGVVAPPVPDNQTEKYGCPAEQISPWLGVYKNSKNPQLAADYLMALFSEEYGYQEAQVSSGNSVSVVPAINDKYMSNPQMIEFYKVASENTRVIPVATSRDSKVYEFNSVVNDVSPSLGAIVQGVLAQSIDDYYGQLDKLANDSTIEWKRAAKEVGLDFSVFEFPNWDLTKNYTDADYQALK
jgi:ABC-type glycerol-3-phosphate transport system substrate-binding protein